MTRICPAGCNKKDLHEQAFQRADDGIRTHDINLGKVALYH